jgi:hypothetical protein
MGAGIARQIAKMYPEALAADKLTDYGDKENLGTYSRACARKPNGDIVTIANCYTQYYFGSSRVNCDYAAIKESITKFLIDMPYNYKIGIPKIGCGLGGGDWNVVENIIDSIAKSDIFPVERTIFVYTID